MLTNQTHPEQYYVMFDRWKSISDWTLLVLAPVDGIDSAIPPALAKSKRLIEALTNEDVIASTTLRNEGTLDFVVKISERIPSWLELKDVEELKKKVLLLKLAKKEISILRFTRMIWILECHSHF
jgi:hypothetical protein